MKLQEFPTPIGSLNVPIEKMKNEDILLVPHDFLESLIMHPEMIKRGAKIVYEYLKMDMRHSICKCIFTDNTGLHIEFIGESTNDSLKTDIAKEYPSFMAAKRAFDGVMLIFLKIPKAYSDAQIEKATTQPVPLTDDESLDASAPSVMPRTLPKKVETKTVVEPALPEPADVLPKPVTEEDSEVVEVEEDIAELELEEFEEAITDTADEMDEDDALDLTDVVDANAVVTSEVAEDAPVAEAEEIAAESPKLVVPELDIFRTTIVDVGDKKHLKLSVDELGKKHPKSLIWVAEGLIVNDKNVARYGNIQNVCRKWLEVHPEAREMAAGGAA